MDLGCLDLGCIEKQISQSSVDDSDLNPNHSLPSTFRPSKNRATKEANQPSPLALNRLTTQIKKPSRRKTSPLGWFPRKKVDSYLKRKIKLLQEVGGMNSTLDETLGDTNPHYSKVLKEKIAVREAAHKAVEARKAALVEASWCRILHAARIECKEAEDVLVKAEKSAAEAFESAKEIGVIMYDIPDCPRKHYEIETSAVSGGESTTHTVATSFETAFEVDKQVAAAVKAAFVRLSSCPSIGKDEFKELLRKISQNPDLDEISQDSCGLSSECESDAAPEYESGSHKVDYVTNNINGELAKAKKGENLVEMMLKRLRCLNEEELASLATIVATCGLNAALAEAENSSSASGVDGGLVHVDKKFSRKQHVHAELPSLERTLVKRLTRLEREVEDAKNARKIHDEKKICISINQGEEESTGLGSVLVKHYSKLEKEIEEAKKHEREIFEKNRNIINETEVPDFGSMLMKHTSKLEKEIEKAKMESGKSYEPKSKKSERWKQEMKEVPSLDKLLVKRVSKLEREVQEAKKEKENVDLNKKTDREMKIDLNSSVKLVSEATEALSLHDEDKDHSKENQNSLSNMLVKPVHRLEREKEAFLSRSNYENVQQKSKHGDGTVEGLDKVLVKHVSRLEKEKMAYGKMKEEEVVMVKRRDKKSEFEQSGGSLDQILVKPKSRFEKEKVDAAQEQENGETKHPLVAKREARERELREAWGGMSFGNSIRPHVSRLERDKAAWLKAEEEERRVTEEAKVV